MNPYDWFSLTTATLFGLAVFFIVVFIRALPWSAAMRSRKPLTCDACMVGWLIIVLGALLWPSQAPKWIVAHCLAAGGVALLGVALQAKWRAEADQARGWVEGKPV